MWCVFAHHFVIHNADDISVFASPLTRLIFKGVFLPIGKVAVGCFVSIAVWFIADRASFSIKDAVKKLIIFNNEVAFLQYNFRDYFYFYGQFAPFGLFLYQYGLSNCHGVWMVV